MAELIAGAFFTSSFQRFFDMIFSGEVLKFVSGKKLDDGMRKKFKTLLLSVKALLNDAEKKQISDENVRQWLDELKDTMYNAEDLASEIETEALRCMIEGGQSSGSRMFQVFNLSSRFRILNLEDRIVEIFHTLEGILSQKDLLRLSPSEGGVDLYKSTPSSSTQLLPVEEESDIYGRDHDKAAIVKLLLSDDVDDDLVGYNKISVIPIVGMGGIGKTTLAQLVYNDVKVEENFDLKAWVTVSHAFDVFTLTKTIFETITGQMDCKIQHPHLLQSELKKVIKGKKFLFVLDDVWNENYNHWYNLKSQFTFGASGSKIVVTTRNENIGSMMGTVPNHYLGTISDEDCWRLFAKHAFRKGKNQSEVRDYDEIGRGIVKKCNGLPLAVKSLGGLLCSKRHIDEWKDILNNNVWNLPTGRCDILPALWLSYYYLPPYLKRCFAYCSIFPKDYEFEKGILILLWMAEDLLIPQQNKTLEEIGEEYFNDLTSRSFFQRSKVDLFTMHDLINDLAAFISGEFCLRLDEDDSKLVTRKTRHLSYMSYKEDFLFLICQDIKEQEEHLSKNKVMRTLLFQFAMAKQFLTYLEQYLQGMQCLRVLSLCRSPITTGLDSIGSLKLLRYLDLSYTWIEELTDKICTLYYLQTLLLHECRHLYRLSNSIGNLKHVRLLDLSDCGKLEEIPDTLCDMHSLHTLNLNFCRSVSHLPSNMSRLVNLRYLGFWGTRVREMPPQMCKLKHLQYLNYTFHVDKSGGGQNIKELGNLQEVHGSLTINYIENVENVGDVWETKLKEKKHITNLELCWCGETDDSEKAREVLDGLQPHTSVGNLIIGNYQGTTFPSWIGHHSFSHLVYLSLSDCRNCYWLPPLGQLPSLKDLRILGLVMVERIGDEFYCSSSSGSSTSPMVTQPFKSLECLLLDGLRELREWKEWSMVGGGEDTGAFPRLLKLRLRDCPKLNGDSLPPLFPLFKNKNLEIFEGCQQLVASLRSNQLPWVSSLKLIDCCSEEMLFPPQGGLPSTITSIQIRRCCKMKCLGKVGWPSNLKSLRIEGCKKLFVDTHLFPDEGQLPTTLTSLELNDLPELKSLNGMALRDLVCLQQLTVSCCYQLQCLPEEGLPDSLCQLTIKFCGSSLAGRCKRDAGEDWPKIAHIPRLNIMDVAITL